ncbi:type II toxin-antitoxin system VapC family toxin [Amphibiibacter pelophylacis]|uniref:Type II toxin-antitoxin system VapC family toxin n=1 Tax=Amphibiibacter pelophylacis TaxID=1799477 RepID=A0ACC6NZK8_9BURK
MSAAYLLDTNVLSELMRREPAQALLGWLTARPGATLYCSSITQGEILLGIALMPLGKRRSGLAGQAEAMFKADFAGRCLTFDARAAVHYALLVAHRQQAGRPISTEDAQIAATAIAADMPVVTRNSKDFEGIDGLSVINPWQLQ